MPKKSSDKTRCKFRITRLVFKTLGNVVFGYYYFRSLGWFDL